MASRKYFTFVRLFIFLMFFQNNISNNDAANCLNPKFGQDQKVVVEYFFETDENVVLDLHKQLCKVIMNSGNRMSIIYRMGANVRKDENNKATCDDCDLTQDRIYACNYYKSEKIYNICGAVLPALEPFWVGECACTGLADYILINNSNERATKYKIPEENIPALVVNEKWDPCFTDFSFHGIKTYFCTAYNNVLPVCTQSN